MFCGWFYRRSECRTLSFARFKGFMQTITTGLHFAEACSNFICVRRVLKQGLSLRPLLFVIATDSFVRAKYIQLKDKVVCVDHLQMVGRLVWNIYGSLSKRIVMSNTDVHAIYRHRHKWIEGGNQCLAESLPLAAGTLTHSHCRETLNSQGPKSKTFPTPRLTTSTPENS